MKQFIYLITLILGVVLFSNVETSAQAESIKISSAQDKDSLYVMLTDTVESKYRWGKGKFYNTQQSFGQRTFDGHRTYEVVVTQASTAAPTVAVLRNTLVGTPVVTRDSIGTYKFTKTAAFTSAKTSAQATINSGTAYQIKAYRQSDSTLILRVLSLSGIGADLTGTATLTVNVWP